MTSRLHHISFTVSDVKKSESFFIEFFGMKKLGGGIYDFDYISQSIGYPDAILNISILADKKPKGSSDVVLELIEYIQPQGLLADTATNRPGNAHLCFAVDDIEEKIHQLKAAGYHFKSSEPALVTFGINKGARACYLNGPDGIALELFQPAGRAGQGE